MDKEKIIRRSENEMNNLAGILFVNFQTAESNDFMALDPEILMREREDLEGNPTS